MSTRVRNPDAVCGSCPYWCPDPEVIEDPNCPPSEYVLHTGVCHKNAPSVIPYRVEDGYDNIDWNAFPLMKPHEPDSWCGEHPEFWLEMDGRRRVYECVHCKAMTSQTFCTGTASGYAYSAWVCAVCDEHQ